jgi:putative membrane protein
MYYWNNWYTGWGWFLWFGVLILFFSSVGNWGYTYQVHRKYNDRNFQKGLLQILQARYAKGELKEDEYLRLKSEFTSSVFPQNRKAV